MCRGSRVTRHRRQRQPYVSRGLPKSLCRDHLQHFAVKVPPVLVQVYRPGLDAKLYERMCTPLGIGIKNPKSRRR